VNVNKVLAGELVIAIGINSWGAIKQGYVPWAGTITTCGVAFGIIGTAAQFVPELAVWLGGGFLIASIIGIAQGGWGVFGAAPPTGDYAFLAFGGAGQPAKDDD
jgi:hypothetical protein